MIFPCTLRKHRTVIANSMYGEVIILNHYHFYRINLADSLWEDGSAGDFKLLIIQKGEPKPDFVT